MTRQPAPQRKPITLPARRGDRPAPPAPPAHAPIRASNDLARVEAILDRIARRHGTTRGGAEQLVRLLERARKRQAADLAEDTRAAPRGHRNPLPTNRTFDADKQATIDDALAAAGWSLTQLVSRKLPLLALARDLETLVRAGTLDAARAVALNRVAPGVGRAELLAGVLEGAVSLRALERDQRTRARRRPGTGAHTPPLADCPSERAALDADVMALEAQLRDHFGTRASLRGGDLTFRCGTLEGVNALLERLGLFGTPD
jgi:hypothetical protein